MFIASWMIRFIIFVFIVLFSLAFAKCDETGNLGGAIFCGFSELVLIVYLISMAP